MRARWIERKNEECERKREMLRINTHWTLFHPSTLYMYTVCIQQPNRKCVHIYIYKETISFNFQKVSVILLWRYVWCTVGFMCLYFIIFTTTTAATVLFFLKTRKIRCLLFTQTNITFKAVVGCFFQSHWKQWKSNMKQPLPAHKFHKHIDTINYSSFLRQTENTVWFAPKQISTHR